MEDWIARAKALGFTDAARMPADRLVVVPAYRRFCEENRCGNYGVLPACPPQSGTVEEMAAKIRAFDEALVLQSVYTPARMDDAAAHRAAKRQMNERTEQLLALLRQSGKKNLLMMSAGPWKDASCMSAYCVDAQKMADEVGLPCWENDGRVRLFSLILFRSAE